MEPISKLLLIFMQAPSQFCTEQSRVLYASTFLKGSAAHWFSNFLIQQPPPRVVTNWNVFVRELNTMFGDRNRVHTAQQAVLTLQMNNNHQSAATWSNTIDGPTFLASTRLPLWPISTKAYPVASKTTSKVGEGLTTTSSLATTLSTPTNVSGTPKASL